jgi:hypothetical protein
MDVWIAVYISTPAIGKTKPADRRVLFWYELEMGWGDGLMHLAVSLNV